MTDGKSKVPVQGGFEIYNIAGVPQTVKPILLVIFGEEISLKVLESSRLF